MIPLKVLAKKERTIKLQTSGKGDGLSSLYELLKKAKSGDYIVVDRAGDASKAFYISKPFSVDMTEDSIIVSDMSHADSTQLFLMFLFIRNNGNGGHSFPIELNNKDEGGWDGDGSDMVKAVYVNDRKVKDAAYKMDDMSALSYMYELSRE